LAEFLKKDWDEHWNGVIPEPLQSSNSLSLDDLLQQVQQGTLNIEKANQLFQQFYLKEGKTDK
jgi:hypothetical protein